MQRAARWWWLCVALLFFSAWPTDSAGQIRRELRVGLRGVPAGVDPVLASDVTMAVICRQVFDTLLTYREGSTDVEPALAVRWTVSRDGLTWTFALRENVRFHDGSFLTAPDVAASFARQLAAEPATGGVAGRSVWSALLRGFPGVVKQVRATGARTVEIELIQPYAALLTALAHPAFAVVKNAVAPDGTPTLIGTGPYRVVDTSSGRMAVEAHAGHWRAGARTERIVFLEVATDDHAEAELDAGALDVWFPRSPPRRTEGAVSLAGLRVGYLAFQTEKEPFSRKKIRQAVASAIDPVTLGVALDRSAVPLQSFLPPGVWARREGSPVLGGTRAAVRQLLTDGGWPRGFKPTLLVQAANGSLDPQRIGETLVANLAAADIPVHLRVASAAATGASLQVGDHEMVVAEAIVAGGDPHLFLFPLSTSESAHKGRAQNFSFYRNPRVDDLLIRASQLAFRTERQKLYQRAQAMLADDLPWIPLYVRLEWAVMRAEVRGLRLHPTGIHRLDAVSLDVVPETRR